MEQMVFVLGDGYSGTTLLNLILGSHTQMRGLGETDAATFNEFWERNNLCTCLFRARKCYFWAEIMERIYDSTGSTTFRLGDPKQDLTSFVKTTDCLLRAIAAALAGKIAVHSNKRLQQVRLMTEYDWIQPKVVHLVRDGRGVGYSHLKRGESFEQSVFHWRSCNAEILNWLTGSEAPDNIRITYEELCNDPVSVITRLCHFIGVKWESGMTRPGRCIHHNISGNPMRLALGSGEVIKADIEWSSKLTSGDLDLFDDIAGSFALQFGYD
jgi:hypothetical protein